MLGSDDDWIETVRRSLYPKLHPVLVNSPIPGYGVGFVGEKQYVATLTEITEEPFEKELGELGFRRNVLSCFKTNHKDEKSEGSWVLLSQDDPNDRLADDRQLHITLFNHPIRDGLDVYAHEEYDWRVKPFAHLREKDFAPVKGANYARELLDEQTYLVLS